jgi:uncharacterized cupin superfamily protein
MFMALAPGEAFRHVHVEYSITTLHEGSVDLAVGDTVMPLVPGMPTPIDANVVHTMINVGVTPARVECGHLADPVTA